MIDFGAMLNEMEVEAVPVQPFDWRVALAGTQFRAGNGISTVLPDFDFETYSEAGYRWVPALNRWKSLPGLSDQNRGIGAVGARNYVEHPSFRVLSLAWNLKGGAGEKWWRPDPQAYYLFPQYPRYYPGRRDAYHPWELLEYIAAGGAFPLEAFNVPFEWTVWTFYCVPVLGWPELKQENCRCAMAKSRATAHPGALDNVSKVLNTTNRKDPGGDRLIRKLTVPRNPTKGNDSLMWTPFSAEEEFKQFYEYNKQDIRTEAEVSVRLPDLTPREQEIWKLDFRINMRGMQINMPAVEDCIAIIEQAEEKYNAELRRLTNYAVRKTTEVAELLKWISSQGIYLQNLDEDTLEIHLNSKNLLPWHVARVLRIRQQLAFGSVKKYYALRAQTTKAGRLHDQYVYYGAHTGLWNGRGVQPANLYKGVFSKPHQVERALAIIKTRCLELVELEYGEDSQWTHELNDKGQPAGNKPLDALEVVASCLRSMICAAPGHRLISADFTAIQAVATSCMANEPWRIEVFRTHGKIYEAMAAKLTGKSMEFYAQYRKEHGKHHEDRQLGKLAVLSADFGAWIGGWKRFGAEKYGDDEFIKKLILRTRDAIPNVVNYWGGQTVNRFRHNEAPQLFGLEGAIVSAILEPGKCFSSKPGSPLAVLYEVHEDILYCRPPSGGFIRYHSPRLERSRRPSAAVWEFEITYKGWNSNPMKGAVGWIPMSLYGGVATQNTISHMCREIQADALTAADNNGYPVVMHTHDEGVSEVRIGVGSVADYMRITRGSLASWAVCEDGKPWPINIPDAWDAPCYGKWED